MNPIKIIEWHKSHLFGFVKISYVVSDMKPNGTDFDYGKWEVLIQVSIFRSKYKFGFTCCDLRINHKLR